MYLEAISATERPSCLKEMTRDAKYGRDPAKGKTCQYRPHNGTCTCNGGKMMSKKHPLIGGDVVYIVKLVL